MTILFSSMLVNLEDDWKITVAHTIYEMERLMDVSGRRLESGRMSSEDLTAELDVFSVSDKTQQWMEQPYRMDHRRPVKLTVDYKPVDRKPVNRSRLQDEDCIDCKPLATAT